MEIYTVSFFGHRIITDFRNAEKQVESIVAKLLLEKAYVEFLIGRDGEFDLLVSSIIHRCKRTIRDDNSALIWVLPYETAEFRYNEKEFMKYYDGIEICDRSAQAHYKAAYQIRNRHMVERSDLTVFCVEHKSGGAYQTLRYAKEQGQKYVNVAGTPE